MIVSPSNTILAFLLDTDTYVPSRLLPPQENSDTIRMMKISEAAAYMYSFFLGIS